MSIVALFPAYRLLESALLASRREAEELRTELAIARAATESGRERIAELQAEMKEVRSVSDARMVQTSNYMARLKTGRKIFVDAEDNSHIPVQPPAEIPSRKTMIQMQHEAKRQFKKDLADFKPSEAA